MSDDFDWDDANRSHIAEHNVTPEEAEQVLANRPVVLSITQHPGPEDRALVVGVTDAGRYLSVVFTARGERFRIVTAFPASPKRKRMFDDIHGR